jgi:hypothetical protein
LPIIPLGSAFLVVISLILAFSLLELAKQAKRFTPAGPQPSQDLMAGAEIRGTFKLCGALYSYHNAESAVQSRKMEIPLQSEAKRFSKAAVSSIKKKARNKCCTQSFHCWLAFG